MFALCLYIQNVLFFLVLEFRAYDRCMLVVLFGHQGVFLLFVLYKHSLIASYVWINMAFYVV